MSVPPGTPHTLDTRPLTDPIDRRALADDRKGGPGPTEGQAFQWLTIALSVLGGAVVAVIVLNMILTALHLQVPVIVLVILVAIVGYVVVRFLRRDRGAREFRLAHFAAANGMDYCAAEDDRDLPGMLFRRGERRMATDQIFLDGPPSVEFSNFQYTVTTGMGDDKRTQTQHCGYVAIRLATALPNIYLDAIANNLGGRLRTGLDARQRLSLEGDFDAHFALYCPTGYERDALYLFAPDVMAVFIDNAASFDVEIVDDWLFLYAPDHDIVTLDPALWRRLFTVVDALMVKVAGWDRWRDERLRPEASGAEFGTGLPGAAFAEGIPSAPPADSAPPARSSIAAGTPQPWHAPIGVAPTGRRLKGSGPSVRFYVMGVLVGAGFVAFFVGRATGFLP